MQMIYQPKIGLVCFFLIFFVVYLFYLSGEKRYKKGTSQALSYFSGEIPQKEVKLQNIYWGFFKDLEKLYKFLAETKKENAQDYVFFFIFGLIISLLIVCLI